MSVASVTRRGRRAAERLMLDTAQIKRPNGLMVRDEDGDELEDYDDLFVTKCKIQQASRLGQISRPDVGGREAAIVRMSVHLPVSVPQPLKPGDVVEITAVGEVTDPHLLGKAFRLVSPVHKSYPTAFRFEIEEVTA